MKFVRFGNPGQETPGAIDAAGTLRDLSSILSEISTDAISDGSLAAIDDAQIEFLPIVEQPVRFGMPFVGTRKFLGIGLNYHDHAREVGAEIPKEPIL